MEHALACNLPLCVPQSLHIVPYFHFQRESVLHCTRRQARRFLLIVPQRDDTIGTISVDYWDTVVRHYNLSSCSQWGALSFGHHTENQLPTHSHPLALNCLAQTMPTTV